jgi:hypothetical protein
MKQSVLNIEELKAAFAGRDYFKRSDLFQFYKSADTDASNESIDWRILTIVRKKFIHRIGRGTYKFGPGSDFVPQISDKAQEISGFLREAFPYLKYVIWNMRLLNLLLHHLINRDVYYVEVERDAVSSVYERMREEFQSVFKSRSGESNVSEGTSIIVKPLITGSPWQSVKDVPAITIEKLLVDIFIDKDFDFLVGSELIRVFENAFSAYTINTDKLLRYAGRRAKRMEIAEYIRLIKVD